MCFLHHHNAWAGGDISKGVGAGGEKAYSTRYSQTVFFPSTKQTHFCLASRLEGCQIERENKVHEVSFKVHMWTGVSFLGC